jgi:D-proline reductase (dithiol) PrdB
MPFYPVPVSPQIARACIPYTPFKRDLGASRVGLVTTAGVYVDGTEPFSDNDLSFREIPNDVASSNLRVVAGHYDPSSAEADINCVFPIDRLRALQAEGIVRKVSDVHFAMGLTTELRKLKEEVSWELAEAVARTRPDAVVLTGG